MMTEKIKIEQLEKIINQQSNIIRQLNVDNQNLLDKIELLENFNRNNLIYHDAEEIFINVVLIANDFCHNILKIIDNLLLLKNKNLQYTIDYIDYFVTKYQYMFNFKEINSYQIQNFLIKNLK